MKKHITCMVCLFSLIMTFGGKWAKADSVQEPNSNCPPPALSTSPHISDDSARYQISDAALKRQACGAKSKHIKDNFSFSMKSDFRSKYMWRGLLSSTGSVWQPSINLEAYNINLSIWANFVLDDEPNQGQFNEVDFVPSYTYTWKKLSITPAFEYYVYPNSNPASLDYTAKSTVRTALNITYDVAQYLGVFASGEVDLYSARGALWFNTGFDFHHQLTDMVKFNTSMLVGVGDGRYNRAHIANVGTQLDLIQWNFVISVSPWKGLVLNPNIHISNITAPRVRQAVNEPTVIYGGLDIVYNF